MSKCNKDCFHCKYEDCIEDDISFIDRINQNYQDLLIQGIRELPLGHEGRKKGRKYGRYDSEYIPNMILKDERD